ncbi:hypothetical protein FB451DRAFT_1370610 [Mycena latifolia]|nr:hypothetical protein FB451DRAFT_1370610 [Mycena latifolia]
MIAGGGAGGSWVGTNISHPFFWVVTRADDNNVGEPQATFTAVLISALFFVRRRRLARRRANNQLLGDTLPVPYKEHAASGTKAALNAEICAVQARLHDLGTPNAESPTEEGGGDSELHRQIAILTAEVERLRAMGAEEPPPYSLQRKSKYMYGAQVLVVVVAGAKHWDQNALRTVQAEPSQQSPVGDHQIRNMTHSLPRREPCFPRQALDCGPASGSNSGRGNEEEQSVEGDHNAN